MKGPERVRTTAERDAEIFAYDAFASKLVAGKVLTDPWVDGRPRFREEPVFVSPSQARALYRAAEDVAAVYNELCLIVEDAPALLDDFFGLTPLQKAMWLASAPLWHGVARADVFMTNEGLAVAELNCDTPTGEAEAVVLGALAASAHPGSSDPNTGFEPRVVAMMETLAERQLGAARGRRVALVYPTEMTDDLALVRLYKSWLERRGYDVVLGSPYNLTAYEASLRLFDVPFDSMIRHYKTDWWGERVTAWKDAVIADTEPLWEPLRATLAASLAGGVSIVNPFGAVLPQNKRSMAFMWEHIHRFSTRSAETIERHVPVSSRLETMHAEQLAAEKDEWVLKSAYGAEGDEVVLGRRVSAEVWAQSLREAREGQWIAQRYFHADTNARHETVNYGVFLVAGEACGLYTRVQEGPTDDRALSAPVLVREPAEGGSSEGR